MLGLLILGALVFLGFNAIVVSMDKQQDELE